MDRTNIIGCCEVILDCFRNEKILNVIKNRMFPNLLITQYQFYSNYIHKYSKTVSLQIKSTFND